MHRAPEPGFDADYLDAPAQCLCSDRHSGDQAAAADRDHEDIERGLRFEHFQRNRALPRHDERVVIRMDECEAFTLGEIVRVR